VGTFGEADVEVMINWFVCFLERKLVLQEMFLGAWLIARTNSLAFSF
jgi:hypothetical protein